MTSTVLVAGATGDLGQRIVRELVERDVRVRVLTRPGSGTATDLFGADPRVDVVAAAYTDHAALTEAVAGVDVVVSAVSGTRPVIVDAQRALLAATVAAGVPRFIPSDYSADYRRITPGTNRNFELRREFAAEVDAAPVRATSILTGMFTDLLTGQAPMILFGRRRVLFWSSADQVLDFTTKDDVARVVALTALDDDAPRVVETAGDHISARDVAHIMSELTGTAFRLQWAGTTGTLSAMSAVGKRLSGNPDETFPAWQGMQYFVSMFSGEAQLRHVDDDRYGPHTWTTVRDVLRAHLEPDATR
ncbi:NmrA family protein [Curtobacterium sp. MCJR17_055]|uniref:NmrA family NAD(P)-binding protein n=1 Tax=unclassified Curtobacterium TaxID=257496 RepID=UPI000D88531E|nr:MULTISPECIES: NmrA family NAD(P)-binding protein [unclassified Curtobacterium]PYY32308.1 NmrA family protein [Curtobacterium sp. MCBD17_029]PYY54635.1 NmrA family protein [Curtobacterium sp. MCJR17_055]PYY60870.1 NmrA family protein [Curtobacterium sp. MCPF17_015]WIB35521.1 NmrA family NAD(P)-binding protein [Curtobacterium sp. MCJR17_043]